jgi:cytochrome c-type biogenesis protein CcmH/NrfG
LLTVLLLSVLALGSWVFPVEGRAQENGRKALSSFDRLAEEASYMNKRGEADQVIALLEPHFADKKNDSALFFNELGVAFRQKGRLPDAIRSYRKALSLDPANPVLMKNLGDAFFFNKEYSKAVEQCRNALQTNPLFHQARFTLGLAYYRLERYKEALDEFETVLRTNPGDEQAAKFREAIRQKLLEKKKK